jgi:hypothetical protein
MSQTKMFSLNTAECVKKSELGDYEEPTFYIKSDVPTLKGHMIKCGEFSVAEHAPVKLDVKVPCNNSVLLGIKERDAPWNPDDKAAFRISCDEGDKVTVNVGGKDGSEAVFGTIEAVDKYIEDETVEKVAGVARIFKGIFDSIFGGDKESQYDFEWKIKDYDKDFDDEYSYIIDANSNPMCKVVPHTGQEGVFNIPIEDL